MASKRLLLPLLIMLIASVGLVRAQESIEIALWQHGGEERPIVLQHIDEFNASQTQYIITYTEIPGGAVAGSGYNDAVNAGAVAGELPCLLDLDGPNLYNYAWAGYLLPLDDYMTDELRADILPSVLSQGLYSNQIFALGQFDSGLGLAARRSALEEMGVRIPTIDEPWTLEEFNEVLARAMELPGYEYAIDLKMNYGAGEWFTYAFSPVVQSFGGDLINREDYMSAEGVLNGPEAVAAMEWIQSLFENGYTTATPPDDNEFVNGKAPLAWFGHWMYKFYHEAFGDDLVILPMPDFGQGARTGMGSWAWAITTQCEHPEAAWAFLEYMLGTEQVLEMSDAMGVPPSRLSVLDDSEAWREGGDMHVLFQQLEQGIALPRPITPAYPAITSAFYTAMDNIIKGADVQTELDRAVDAIDKNIEDNNGYPVGQ